MEFQYTRARVRGYGFSVAILFAIIGANSAMSFMDKPSTWRDLFWLFSSVTNGVLLFVLGREYLRIRRAPWVVRLEPGEVRVQGSSRVKSFSWTELEKAKSSLEEPAGESPANWGEFLSRPPDSPSISLNRGNVTPRDLLTLAVEFYVANPAFRAELSDPARAQARLEELKKSSR